MALQVYLDNILPVCGLLRLNKHTKSVSPSSLSHFLHPQWSLVLSFDSAKASWLTGSLTCLFIDVKLPYFAFKKDTDFLCLNIQVPVDTSFSYTCLTLFFLEHGKSCSFPSLDSWLPFSVSLLVASVWLCNRFSLSSKVLRDHVPEPFKECVDKYT